MPTYKIRGIDVDFPFDAYDSQLVYMDKVLQSLQQVTITALFTDSLSGIILLVAIAK